MYTRYNTEHLSGRGHGIISLHHVCGAKRILESTQLQGNSVSYN